MKGSTLCVLVAAVRLAGLASPSIAATEIQFWHAMTAVAGDLLTLWIHSAKG